MTEGTAAEMVAEAGAAADAEAEPAPVEATAAGAGTAGAEADSSGGIAIDPAAREVLHEEIAALTGALRDPAVRAGYQELAAAASAGEVPAELEGRLATALELSLGSGRARRMHGAQHEEALRQLWLRTAAGGALRRQAEAAARALGALAGQRLEGVGVSAQAPGLFRLRLTTDRCQVTFEVSRDGIAVTELSVGG